MFKKFLIFIFCLFFQYPESLASAILTTPERKRIDREPLSSGRRRAASAKLILGPGGGKTPARIAVEKIDKDEGWRWVESFQADWEGNIFDFSALHKQLMDAEQNISTNWKEGVDSLRKNKFRIGNITNAAITIIYQLDGSSYLKRKTILIQEDAQKIFFESGLRDTILPLKEALLTRKKELPAAIASAKTKEERERLLEKQSRLVIPTFPEDVLFLGLEDIGETKSTLLSSLRQLFIHSLAYRAIPFMKSYPAETVVRELLKEIDSIPSPFSMDRSVMDTIQLFIHSEQVLRLYLLNGDKRRALLEKFHPLPAGTKIKSIILHIHTKLDMCPRCATTWSIEAYSYRDNPKNYGTVLSSIKTTLEELGFNIDKDFKSFIFVSSREYPGVGKDRILLHPRRPSRALDIHSPIYLTHTPILAFHKIPDEHNMVSFSPGGDDMIDSDIDSDDVPAGAGAGAGAGPKMPPRISRTAKVGAFTAIE